jgi:hypothetical protein
MCTNHRSALATDLQTVNSGREESTPPGQGRKKNTVDCAPLLPGVAIGDMARVDLCTCLEVGTPRLGRQMKPSEKHVNGCRCTDLMELDTANCEKGYKRVM